MREVYFGNCLSEFIENALLNKVTFIPAYDEEKNRSENLFSYFNQHAVVTKIASVVGSFQNGEPSIPLWLFLTGLTEKKIIDETSGRKARHFFNSPFTEGDRDTDYELTALHILMKSKAEFSKEIDFTNEDYFKNLGKKEYPQTFKKFWEVMGRPGDQELTNYFNEQFKILETSFNVIRAMEYKTGLYVVDDIFVAELYETLYERKLRTQKKLYQAVNEAFKNDIEKINNYSGSINTYVPPFTSIILSRSKDRSEIPEQVVKAKIEFSELIELENKYNTHISDQSKPLKERIEVINEYEKMHSLLIKKIAPHPKERKIFRIWDIVKSFNPIKITENIIEEIKNEGGNIKLRYRMKPHVDLYRKINELKNYDSLIRRTFKTDLN